MRAWVRMERVQRNLETQQAVRDFVVNTLLPEAGVMLVTAMISCGTMTGVVAAWRVATGIQLASRIVFAAEVALSIPIGQAVDRAFGRQVDDSFVGALKQAGIMTGMGLTSRVLGTIGKRVFGELRTRLPNVQPSPVTMRSRGVVHMVLPEGTTRARRRAAGTAFGGRQLPAVNGQWLTDGVAGYVPPSVANRLRGRQFRDWDHFREEFWKAVAAEPQLANQFNAQNRAYMAGGQAPIAPRGLQYGGRREYEIHHIEAIQRGGGVYDLDNLIVLAPLPHMGIHNPQVFVPRYRR